MARKRRHQSDQRADLKGKGFIGLPRVVKESGAYRSLSVFDRAVLIEILSVFNGYNNGKLVISHRQIAEALGNSNFGKISRSIATLIERGLVDIETESIWKERMAREYRLTFIGTGSAPHYRPATNEYLMWKNGADEASAGRTKTAPTQSAERYPAADHVSAANAQKP